MSDAEAAGPRSNSLTDIFAFLESEGRSAEASKPQPSTSAERELGEVNEFSASDWEDAKEIFEGVFPAWVAPAGASMATLAAGVRNGLMGWGLPRGQQMVVAERLRKRFNFVTTPQPALLRPMPTRFNPACLRLHCVCQQRLQRSLPICPGEYNAPGPMSRVLTA